jgi:hypothetical protein
MKSLSSSGQTEPFSYVSEVLNVVTREAKQCGPQLKALQDMEHRLHGGMRLMLMGDDEIEVHVGKRGELKAECPRDRMQADADVGCAVGDTASDSHVALDRVAVSGDVPLIQAAFCHKLVHERPASRSRLAIDEPKPALSERLESVDPAGVRPEHATLLPRGIPDQ